MDWDVFLSLFYGAAGFVVATVLHAMLGRSRVPRSHRRYRERILTLLHQRVSLEMAIADVEADLLEAWQAAPDGQARLIVRTVEQARMLPDRFRELARRFGFDVPDEPKPMLSMAPTAPSQAPEPSEPSAEPGAWVLP